MKKLSVLLLFVIFAFTSNAIAQGKFGKDSVECVRSLSFYNDYMKQGNLNEAAPLWRDAMKYCPPGLRQTIYVDGQKIYRFLIEKYQSNSELKNKLVDSLLMMYDLRTQYFPKYAQSAQTNKVIDIVNFKGSDNKLVFDALMENINTFSGNAEPSLMVLAMQRASTLFNDKVIDAERVLALYSKLSPLIEAQVQANHPDAIQAKKDIDNLFAVSGVASCENITTLFTPKFNADPNNKELVSGIVKLLNQGGCFQEPLFLKAVESMHRMEPSYYTAYYLYKLYSIKESHSQAVKSLQEAIDDPASAAKEDAQMLYELGSYYLAKMENLSMAANAARQIVENDPSMAGKAYMLMGSVWASSRCAGNEIESRAKWWVAVDYYTRAKNADPSLAEDADRLISTYRQYFPLQEEAFMYDIVDGNSFTATCSGMRENTVVRTRK